MLTSIHKNLRKRKLLLFSHDPTTLNTLVNASVQFENQAETFTIPNNIKTNWFTFAIESGIDLIVLDVDELTFGYEEFVEQVKLLKSQNKEIIILSSDIYSSLLAIECLAFYFILKPIKSNLNKITHAIRKGFDKMSELEKMNTYKSTIENSNAEKNESSKVSLPISKSVTFNIVISNILRIESYGQYSVVYLKKAYNSKIKFTLNVGISICDELMPEYFFFRVHKKFIINRLNIKNVERLENNSLLIHTNSDLKIPVSRRKKKAFLTWKKV